MYAFEPEDGGVFGGVPLNSPSHYNSFVMVLISGPAVILFAST